MTTEMLEREFLGRPVRGLQYMLRRLAEEYPFLPKLAGDGIFGEETLEAVMLFQREFYPPVTGVVDLGTWNAIRARWYDTERRIAPPRPLRAFPGERRRAEPGEEREFLILPQAMFQVLGRHLAGVLPHPADGVHGAASVANVRWLQRAAGLEETGVLDRLTWDALSRLYEVFVIGAPETPAPYRGGWG